MLRMLDVNEYQYGGGSFRKYALMSVLSVPICGLFGYLIASPKEGDFTGLGYYMVIYIWLLSGAISGLVLLKISRRRNETANFMRKISLIINWGALMFLAAVPFVLTMLD
jgi:hypothetical protein